MVDDEYRVRTGYIVKLRPEEMRELHDTASVVVDIDGMDVEIIIDQRRDSNEHLDVDERITMAPQDVGRLISGFFSDYYSILDGKDLILAYDNRLAGEEKITRDAGGYVNPFGDKDEYFEPVGYAADRVKYPEADEDGFVLRKRVPYSDRL